MCFFGLDMDGSQKCVSLASILTVGWNVLVWLGFGCLAGMFLFGLHLDAMLEWGSLAWILTLRWNVVLWIVF